MAVIAIMPTPAIQSAALESAARKRAMPCRRCRMWSPSDEVAGARDRPPAASLYSAAWMSSTSFFISGVAAYFS